MGCGSVIKGEKHKLTFTLQQHHTYLFSHIGQFDKLNQVNCSLSTRPKQNQRTLESYPGPFSVKLHGNTYMRNSDIEGDKGAAQRA